MSRIILLSVFLIGGLNIAGVVNAATIKSSAVPVTVAVAGFHCFGCPTGLVKDLAKLPGVSKVKGTLKPAQVTALLDESKLTASEFVLAIAKHPRMMEPKETYGAQLIVYVDSPMCAGEKNMCKACPPEITKMLKAVKGMRTISLDSTGKVITLSFTGESKVATTQLAAALKKSTLKFTVSFTHPTAVKKAVAVEDDGGACCNGGCCK